MVAAARAFVINPFGDQYPDDDSTKTVVLQAEGLTAEYPDDRHVLLHWLNGMAEDGSHYAQVIHLTGGPGTYQFHTPQVKLQSERSLELNTFYVLGQYTRVQRDQIVALAKAVKFNKKSRVNNCQTWMRSLLMDMVNNESCSRTPGRCCLGGSGL
ncbi:hypothetical protein BKA83DRAFT_2074958 [Pisolithus microcarpus]|nr:hypothetical protein BKA83DRAFT_2074958 [Pisolithus microcarpus]